ncbi:MAG: DUF433 domain-containing protein [Ignavibacteriales bacterium]|nr:DUF433 domain-containing protein [Ignavibacteriales bacterium]
MEKTDYIVSDQEIMDGIPVLQGTRFPVYIILEMLDEGFSFSEIQKEYPFLSDEQIHGAIHFATECVSLPLAA